MVRYLNLRRLLLESMILILVVLLGKEWIDSLPSYTDTAEESLYLFIWPFVVLMLIYRLIPARWIRFLLSAGFIIVWYQQTLWTYEPFFSTGWLADTYYMLKYYSIDIMRLDLASINPILRTGLSYICIWIAVYVLHSLVFMKRKAFNIFIVTVLYLAVLDTFFLFDGKWPIIRVFFYGCVLLALLHLKDMERVINRKIIHLNLTPWLMTILAIVVFIGSFAYFVPKGGANWPDPVSFLTSLKAEDGGVIVGGSNFSGYSDNDTRLGGDFIRTNNIIFEAEIFLDEDERLTRHYWRGEAKEYYTGHGWETHFDSVQPYSFDNVNPHTLLNMPEMIEVRERVTMQESSDLFFFGGQLMTLTPMYFDYSGEGREGQSVVTINADTFKIQSRQPVIQYTLTSEIPVITEQTLIDLSEKYDHSTSNYPAEIMEIYTQLPDTLPERVSELAKRIVGNETNIYKQVKKVEYYLRWTGYQYKTEGIPYPEEGQDFVDQFLFDTRRGYCDHFSTAMIVLLRTQGIPARWVKGYTYGDRENNSGNIVTVRGKHAHSWVEVYFPEVGWVPFEPTASFSYPFEVVYTENPLDAQPASLVVPEADDFLEEEIARSEEIKQEARERATKQSALKAVLWIAIGLFVVVLAVLLVKYRTNIILWLYRLLIRKENRETLAYRGYLIILQWLEKIFFVRSHDQTIREYIANLHLRDERTELNELTRAFEDTRYGEKEPKLSKREYIDVWSRLLKKLRS